MRRVFVLAAFAAFLLVPSASARQHYAILAPPANLHQTGSSQSSFDVAWNSVTGAVKYGVAVDGVQVATPTGLTYTRTGLACGTSHLVKVRTYNAKNQAGAYSTAITATTAVCTAGSEPPPAGGYFSLLPVGATLPSGSQCAALVHQSTWEPRPDNYKRNHVLVDPAAVRAAFQARPYDSSYDSRWNTYLLPRVDGQFTGTTDEIFQWAACKWGLPDNVLRAIAVRESTWYQYEVYPDGRPVNNWGSGDVFQTPTADSQTFCSALARLGGYDYQTIDGAGVCPKTFSITGVMSWEAPSWGQMPDNQNGTFPFNRDSTAFAEDYIGSYLRGCYEGWVKWLGPSGDLWSCVGSWYSGDWRSTAALGYISRVQNELANHTWLQADWPLDRPACSPTLGCPVGG